MKSGCFFRVSKFIVCRRSLTLWSPRPLSLVPFSYSAVPFIFLGTDQLLASGFRAREVEGAFQWQHGSISVAAYYLKVPNHLNDKLERNCKPSFENLSQIKNFCYHPTLHPALTKMLDVSRTTWSFLTKSWNHTFFLLFFLLNQFWHFTLYLYFYTTLNK